MNIITRAEWGAKYANGFGDRPLPAKEVWLHHSATIAPDILPPFDDDYRAIRSIEEIGQQRFRKGISYTSLFTPIGLVFEGHSIHRVGSHTANRNTISVGYCLVGNYSISRVTPAQKISIAWRLQQDYKNGWITTPKINGGHRDLKSTECPGNYAYKDIAEINKLAVGPEIKEIPDMQWDEVRDYINPEGNYKEKHPVGAVEGYNYYRISDTYKLAAKMSAQLDSMEDALSDDEANILAAFREGITAVLSTEQLQELRSFIKEAESDEDADEVINKFWERLAPNTSFTPQNV